MATEKVKRKLAAILSADVKGYSRMMGEDEEGTLQTLYSCKEVMIYLIRQYSGRVVGTAGDSLLVEFASVVDAVKCAVEIQKDLKTRATELPEERRMEFRIGINLGDVIEEEDTIYGDGVNIAARVQSLADGGGICISGTVYDQVEKKLKLEYEYLGEQSVKNIAKSIRVYRVRMEAVFSQLGGEKKVVRKPLSKPILAVAAVVVVVAAVVFWQFVLRPSPSKIEVASKEKMAFPLPDKPSIAVLPFTNMSDDPKQEYFSDGMTEDLITDLSKISGLLVIARNSTFTYKGKPVKVKQVAEELGVRYVLEGSVRRAGDEIRINAQLIDALSGLHLWAERYDSTISKIFALQDQITQKIVSALEVKLTGNEKELVAQRGTNNVAAHDEFLKGWGHYLRFTPTDFEKAVLSFKKAIELDPNYGRAYAALALVHWTASTNLALRAGLGGMFDREARMQSREYLKKAMKQPTSISYDVSSQMYLQRRQHNEAISELERGLALDPNDPSCYQSMGYTLIMAGRPKEAIEYVNKGNRLDPLNPSRYLYLLGLAHFYMGDLTEAAALLEKALRLNPENESIEFDLAAFYGLMGRDQEARITLNTVRKKVLGGTTTGNMRSLMFIKPFKDRAVAEGYAEGILKAGMPDQPSGYLPAFKENQLTGEKIKTLLFGSAITGIDIFIGQWWIDYKKNGEFIWRGITSFDIGKSRIEGDMICTQYQEGWWGLEHCATLFRNPSGTPERKNEYFFFGDLWWEFSPMR